ncbi:MAG: M3 family metallopeptidase [Nonlabens sp.]
MSKELNPLLVPFDTYQDTAPFDSIEESHFEFAFAKALQIATEEINTITENTEQPTFYNTIEALDKSGERLGRISSIFFNLNSAETNDEIQRIAREISPQLSKFGNDVTLNEALFKRVKSVHAGKEGWDLNQEQLMLLDKTYKRFSRNGAHLPDEKKEQLRKVDEQLAQLSLKFGENLLAATNDYELHLEDDTRLFGLPESSKEAARETADLKGKEGYVFTLDYPSYIPFMTYVDDRELREQMYRAFSSKSYGGEFDNRQQVLDISKLRYERAQILGYKTHAHFVLEERMAKSPEQVQQFLEELLDKATPAAEAEFNELQNFAITTSSKSASTGQITKLQKWDTSFYSEKLKQRLFNLDDEQLKPYFKLENVIQGVFEVSKKLFGLEFIATNQVEKYHDDVLTYEVIEDGSFKAILYADFFPRDGKRNGAWMTSFKSQSIDRKENVRPHISIVCNFTKPTKTKPSLLTFNEVTTLFHEFGHALHGMLANTTYSSLSGTSVSWDFVELPSQILENWCYEKEALELFARHFETGEVIPLEFIERIKAAATFQEGLQTLRQISFGLLDLSWHGIDPSSITDVKEHERKVFDDIDLYPDVEGSCMSTAFAHIFQGGYSAGYYSYKWAEVLDADAFEAFKKEGVFNEDVATRFKENILTKGGTEEPMELYKKFRGSEPDVNALLRRSGLMEKNQSVAEVEL